jgi:hypothetical protein
MYVEHMNMEHQNLQQMVEEEMAKTKDLFLSYPWEDSYAHALWLAQTWYMVSHSTRLVAMAGAYVVPGNESLHARFVDHSKEERGHQAICLTDMKALGYKLSDFQPTFQAQAMYQVQYYWIQFRGAASFFGYTLALECLAEKFGPEVAARVAKAHGPKASVFWKLHSEDDQEHTQSAFKHIEKLSPQDAQAAKENLLLSCQTYRSMLVDLHAKLKSRYHQTIQSA